MTMLKIMAFSVAAMLGLFVSPVLAEGGAYQIELIIFSQAMPNTEVFEQTGSQINWPTDLTELSAYKKPDNTTLDDSYSALSKDSAYRPLLHVAWVQQAGAPVHIQSSDGRLDGYLRMQQDQGLQVAVDLEFSANKDDGKASAPYLRHVDTAFIYRLNEKRAIKLNEVYYLDHPKFGVIAKISPQ